MLGLFAPDRAAVPEHGIKSRGTPTRLTHGHPLNRDLGLGGELTPDDVIGKVFATFCVGK